MLLHLVTYRFGDNPQSQEEDNCFDFLFYMVFPWDISRLSQDYVHTETLIFFSSCIPHLAKRYLQKYFTPDWHCLIENNGCNIINETSVLNLQKGLFETSQGHHNNPIIFNGFNVCWYSIYAFANSNIIFVHCINGIKDFISNPYFSKCDISFRAYCLQSWVCC